MTPVIVTFRTLWIKVFQIQDDIIDTFVIPPLDFMLNTATQMCMSIRPSFSLILVPFPFLSMLIYSTIIAIVLALIVPVVTVLVFVCSVGILIMDTFLGKSKK